MTVFSLFVVLFALLVFCVVTYNALVRKRNAYKNAFSQIDVQLQRRFDLIPNLVEVAKRYMAHEQDTLTAVVQARNTAQGALNAAKRSLTTPTTSRVTLDSLADNEQALTASLQRLLVVAEAYPELKANTTMAQLSEELASTENKVAFARQAYNDAVMEYNTAIQSFPASVLAHAFGFDGAGMFEVDKTTKDKIGHAPRVDF